MYVKLYFKKILMDLGRRLTDLLMSLITFLKI